MKTMLASFGIIFFALWTTGCYSYVPVTQEELGDIEDTPISIKTRDGQEHTLLYWRILENGDIEDVKQGSEGIDPLRNSYTRFNKAAIQEIRIERLDEVASFWTLNAGLVGAGLIVWALKNGKFDIDIPSGGTSPGIDLGRWW